MASVEGREKGVLHQPQQGDLPRFAVVRVTASSVRFSVIADLETICVGCLYKMGQILQVFVTASLHLLLQIMHVHVKLQQLPLPTKQK